MSHTTYRIYTNASSELHAVKEGWSWWGAICGCFWGLNHHLWKPSIAHIIFVIILIRLQFSFNTILFVILVLNLAWGRFGNNLRANKLSEDGFVVSTILYADSSEDAINSYEYLQKKHLSEYNRLTLVVNAAYLDCFNATHDANLFEKYLNTTKQLFDYIDAVSQSLPKSTKTNEKARCDNQKIAIALHKSYLDTFSNVQKNINSNTSLDLFIDEGIKLESHLIRADLSNKITFAESHALNIAIIRQARYQQALDALKSNPTNPALHTQALQLGREYAESTRAEGVVTLFDETALANDIRAVTANAAQVSAIGDTSSANPTTATASLDERIAKLLKLKAAGLLSDAEFEQKRQALIDEV